MRELLRMVRAHDRGHLSSRAVAERLSELNYEVHLAVRDESVGPRSIVAWRHRKGGVHKGGGGHQFFTGAKVDTSTLSLPTVANGMEVHAIISALMPQLQDMFEAVETGGLLKELDKDELNAELVKLPDKPDENLR